MPELELLPAGLSLQPCWQLLSWHGNTIGTRGTSQRDANASATPRRALVITVRDYIN